MNLLSGKITCICMCSEIRSIHGCYCTDSVKPNILINGQGKTCEGLKPIIVPVPALWDGLSRGAVDSSA